MSSRCVASRHGRYVRHASREACASASRPHCGNQLRAHGTHNRHTPRIPRSLGRRCRQDARTPACPSPAHGRRRAASPAAHARAPRAWRRARLLHACPWPHAHAYASRWSRHLRTPQHEESPLWPHLEVPALVLANDCNADFRSAVPLCQNCEGFEHALFFYSRRNSRQ